MKDKLEGYYIMTEAKRLAESEGKDPNKLTYGELQHYMNIIIKNK